MLIKSSGRNINLPPPPPPVLLNKSDVPHQGQLAVWQNLLEWNQRGDKAFLGRKGCQSNASSGGFGWRLKTSRIHAAASPRRHSDESTAKWSFSSKKGLTCALANETQLDPWHLSTSATSILKRAQMLRWKGTNKLPLLLPVVCCCSL